MREPRSGTRSKGPSTYKPTLFTDGETEARGLIGGRIRTRTQMSCFLVLSPFPVSPPESQDPGDPGPEGLQAGLSLPQAASVLHRLMVLTYMKLGSDL